MVCYLFLYCIVPDYFFTNVASSLKLTQDHAYNTSFKNLDLILVFFRKTWRFNIGDISTQLLYLVNS